MKHCSKVFVLTTMIFLITTLAAQGPDTLWTKTYGGFPSYDIGVSVQQTSDSGYIIVGIKRLWDINKDVYLIRTNSLGDSLWTKMYGGDSADVGNSIQQTSDDGYIICGSTKSFGAGSYDVWLIKTNSSGDTIWTRTYGGVLNDGGSSVQQTLDSGYIIVGSTESYGTGSEDVWLIKTNSSGDSIWTRTYGGFNDDIGKSVSQTTDGGYIIGGYTKSLGSGNGDVWLIRTNSSGDTIWTKTYGGVEFDVCNSVRQTLDGGYIAAGYTYSVNGPPDFYLVKTDPSGDTLWTRTYGGNGIDIGCSVQLASDNGYIVGGYTTSFGLATVNAYLVRISSNGGILWSNTYGWRPDGLYEAFSIVRSDDGGYAFTGKCDTLNQFGCVWLVKTKPDTLEIEERQVSEILCRELEVYPNPVRKECNVKYTLLRRTRVSLLLYDVAGRLIRKIFSENHDIGSYHKTVSLADLPEGVYFLMLNTQEYSGTRKIVHTN